LKKQREPSLGVANYSGTSLSLGTPPSLNLKGLLAKGKGRESLVALC
jgi:hypothetical protein